MTLLVGKTLGPSASCGILETHVGPMTDFRSQSSSMYYCLRFSEPGHSQYLHRVTMKESTTVRLFVRHKSPSHKLLNQHNAHNIILKPY